MALTTTIKSIQDIMRKDVGVDGDAQRIGQLVWMLFLNPSSSLPRPQRSYLGGVVRASLCQHKNPMRGF